MVSCKISLKPIQSKVDQSSSSLRKSPDVSPTSERQGEGKDGQEGKVVGTGRTARRTLRKPTTHDPTTHGFV